MSIGCKGIGIPIFWVNLKRAGNSKTPERIQALNKAINLIGKKRIKYFLADREFVGSEWFNWLLESSIPFLIRIKKNTMISHCGYHILVDSLFKRVRIGKKKTLKKAVKIKGQLEIWKESY